MAKVIFSIQYEVQDNKRDEFINGVDKKRSGYSFNPNIRLEIIDDRIIGD